MRFLSIRAIVIALSSTSSVTAETPEERAACINDAFRLCLSAIPDRSQVYNLVTSSISASQITAKK